MKQSMLKMWGNETCLRMATFSLTTYSHEQSMFATKRLFTVSALSSRHDATPLSYDQNIIIFTLTYSKSIMCCTSMKQLVPVCLLLKENFIIKNPMCTFQ